jgi:hypothetical protein
MPLSDRSWQYQPEGEQLLACASKWCRPALLDGMARYMMPTMWLPHDAATILYDTTASLAMDTHCGSEPAEPAQAASGCLATMQLLHSLAPDAQ